MSEITCPKRLPEESVLMLNTTPIYTTPCINLDYYNLN